MNTQEMIDKAWKNDAERYKAALEEIKTRTSTGGYGGRMSKKEVYDLFVFAYNAILPALRKPNPWRS